MPCSLNAANKMWRSALHRNPRLRNPRVLEYCMFGGVGGRRGRCRRAGAYLSMQEGCSGIDKIPDFGLLFPSTDPFHFALVRPAASLHPLEICRACEKKTIFVVYFEDRPISKFAGLKNSLIPATKCNLTACDVDRVVLNKLCSGQWRIVLR